MKKPILFDILDTAGQEDISAMREGCIRGGDGFLCVLFYHFLVNHLTK